MSEKIFLPLSIVVAGLLIGGGFYLNSKAVKNEAKVQTKQELKSVNLQNSLRPIDENDHILGNPKARILIVEYSDTECPFCKVFHTTMLALMQVYGKDEKIAWVYRHFPITEIHQKSFKQAEAQECAASLGGNSKFWEYTNKLYEVTPSNDGLEYSELSRIATQVGLDTEKFNLCLESGQFAARVNIDIQNAKELEAEGTPFSILIDTKTGEHYPIIGAYPFGQLKSVIDLILQS